MKIPKHYFTPNRFLEHLCQKSLERQAEYMFFKNPQPVYIDGNNYVKAKHKQRALAFQHITVDGFIAEYGVADGNSFLQLCELTAQNVYGFDSFEGLNEEWKGNVDHSEAFQYDGIVPFTVPENGVIVKGYYDDTLQHQEYDKQAVALAHIDCDLHSSTKCVLEHLLPYLREGTVIVFDDYFNQYNYHIDSEFSAWQDFVAENNITYEYLYSCSPAVTVKITKLQTVT